MPNVHFRQNIDCKSQTKITHQCVTSSKRVWVDRLTAFRPTTKIPTVFIGYTINYIFDFEINID